MHYAIILGAAALVAGSPAPQAFDPNALNAAPAVLAQGPPVGVGPTSEVVYNQGSAQTQAAGVATALATAAANQKRGTDDKLEARWFWNWPQPTKSSNTPVAPPTPTPTHNIPAPSTSSGYATVPSSCTPVSWTNTWAFTTVTNCPTAIEVGTYCGFINPLDPCAPQPKVGSFPQQTDTPESFLKNPAVAAQALGAVTPSGYTQAFSNLQGSVTGGGYLGYKLLGSYDVNACSAFCDETDTCTGFNVFIERSPAWNPDQCSCTGSDVESLYNYKCSIWGQKVSKETATNTGETRNGYVIEIAASNGYNKGTYSPPTPPSCSKPTNCDGKLIDQPRYCMGQKTFPGPFDPSLCAAYAQAQNALNKKTGWIATMLAMFGMSKGSCNQFQASYLDKNGVGYGTHCRLFTKQFTPQQATLDIGASGDGSWGCQKAYTWNVDVGATFNWGGWSW